VPTDEWVRQTLIAVRKHPESPYIFCAKNGKPYTDIRKSFFTVCKKSGIINSHIYETFAVGLQKRTQGILSGGRMDTFWTLEQKTVEVFKFVTI
jgi:hypothetical protein